MPIDHPASRREDRPASRGRPGSIHVLARASSPGYSDDRTLTPGLSKSGPPVDARRRRPRTPTPHLDPAGAWPPARGRGRSTRERPRPAPGGRPPRGGKPAGTVLVILSIADRREIKPPCVGLGRAGPGRALASGPPGAAGVTAPVLGGADVRSGIGSALPPRSSAASESSSLERR